MGSELFRSHLNLQHILGMLFLSIVFLCYILFAVCAWGCCLGSIWLQFGMWLSIAVCFILLLVSAFSKTSWCFQLITPKCLTLILWLWSPYQPPPSFSCWGLPLAMPSYGGEHVYLEIACTLASNCHNNSFVVTPWYQAGSMQTDSPAYPMAWLPWPSVSAGELTPASSIWRWCFLSRVSG